MTKLLKWLGLRRQPTREELESKYDASITLWSDTKEAIMTHPIARHIIVAENLKHAEMMLQCDYPEGEIYRTPDGQYHVNSTCIVDESCPPHGGC